MDLSYLIGSSTLATTHGLTSTLVALIVALSSGIAFLVCAREFIRELFRPEGGGSQLFGFEKNSVEKNLRRHRNIVLDDVQSFVVEDVIFEEFLRLQGAADGTASREVVSRTRYLAMMGFLGLIALAGFFAGFSQFV